MTYASFYLSMLDELKRLNNEDFGLLVRCLMQYAETGTEPEGLGNIAVYFDIYKGKIDIQRKAAVDKSNAQSERAKNVGARIRSRYRAMPKNATAYHGIPRHPMECRTMPRMPLKL